MATVALLALLAHSESAKMAVLQEQIQEAKKSSDVASLEMQSRCAKQAALAFKQGGWDADKLADSINHYNKKLGKCFIEITDPQFDGHPAQANVVADAFEGKVYASYHWANDSKKPFQDVAPLECTVTLPSGETKYCKSSVEFDDLISIYMQ